MFKTVKLERSTRRTSKPSLSKKKTHDLGKVYVLKRDNSSKKM